MLKRITTALVLLALTLGCGANTSDSDIRSGVESGGLVHETTIDRVYSVTDLETSDGRLFILDGEERKVKVYLEETGEEILSFGGEGRGPGEFVEPQAIAVYGDKVAVTDISNRLTIFDLEGNYVDSFLLTDLIFLASDLAFADSETLVVGGEEKPVTTDAPKYLHVYSLEGQKKASFFNSPAVEAEYQITVASGVRFGFKDNDSILAVRPTYKNPAQFSIAGDSLGLIDAEMPHHYRPPQSPQPDISSREELMDWINAWDSLHQIFVSPDHFVFVFQSRADGGSTEGKFTVSFHDIKSGELIDTYETDNRLAQVVDGKYYFISEPVDDLQFTIGIKEFSFLQSEAAH